MGLLCVYNRLARARLRAHFNVHSRGLFGPPRKKSLAHYTVITLVDDGDDDDDDARVVGCTLLIDHRPNVSSKCSRRKERIS